MFLRWLFNAHDQNQISSWVCHLTEDEKSFSLVCLWHKKPLTRFSPCLTEDNSGTFSHWFDYAFYLHCYVTLFCCFLIWLTGENTGLVIFYINWNNVKYLSTIPTEHFSQLTNLFIWGNKRFGVLIYHENDKQFNVTRQIFPHLTLSTLSLTHCASPSTSKNGSLSVTSFLQMRGPWGGSQRGDASRRDIVYFDCLCNKSCIYDVHQWCACNERCNRRWVKRCRMVGCCVSPLQSCNPLHPPWTQDGPWHQQQPSVCYDARCSLPGQDGLRLDNYTPKFIEATG